MSESQYTKVALVTGAASGIGQALAVAYAQIGVAVVGGYFPGDPHDPRETERAVAEAGGQCVMQPVDVTSADQVDAFAAVALERFGRIDFAVANAGLLRAAPLTDMRASNEYRMKTAQNLLRRYWLETRADTPLDKSAVSPFACA